MEFGPSKFEDSVEAFFKLRHTGSLREYISEFKRLATRSPNLGLLKSCFIGELKKELKFDVKLLKPVNVHDAIFIVM